MPLASHIQLPERYRVNRHIASGGMASVWEVDDLLLGRVVAVKVLGAQYAADPAARARFQREARTAARVSDHTNIATIYDIGEHAEDAFIVMEYFAGGTVADRLRIAGAEGRRLPRETALRWLHEAAAGFDHAHAADIIHRDVKPANLLIDAHERVAVADFGIARLADDTPMTQTGQLLGTAAYLSPEQAIGRAATAASDRYAFAVVAYELLTGTRPFAGGPPTAQVRQHAEAQPLPASEAAPGLPAAVDRVFARGLAKDPSRRPATSTELADELEHALEPPGRTEPTRRLTPIAPVPVPEPEPAAEAPPEPEPRRREPPPPPPPRPAAERPHEPRRASPFVGIAIAAAIVGIVVAIALANAGGGDGQNTGTSASKTTTQGSRERTQATTPAAAPEEEAQTPAARSPQPPPASTAGASDPAALNDQGFALVQKGSYAAAVEPLQASVEGYRNAGRTSELGYAYALYNLGVALNRSGDPAAAVEVLQERLKFPNQRGTVRKELRDAQSKLGGDKAGKDKG